MRTLILEWLALRAVGKITGKELNDLMDSLIRGICEAGEVDHDLH